MTASSAPVLVGALPEGAALLGAPSQYYFFGGLYQGLHSSLRLGCTEAGARVIRTIAAAAVSGKAAGLAWGTVSIEGLLDDFVAEHLGRSASQLPSGLARQSDGAAQLESALRDLVAASHLMSAANPGVPGDRVVWPTRKLLMVLRHYRVALLGEGMFRSLLDGVELPGSPRDYQIRYPHQLINIPPQCRPPVAKVVQALQAHGRGWLSLNWSAMVRQIDEGKALFLEELGDEVVGTELQVFREGLITLRDEGALIVPKVADGEDVWVCPSLKLTGWLRAHRH
jgi:hypothetical protein